MATSPHLIVFDLDGTLVDSRTDLATAANFLIEECGGTPLDERTLAAMIGEGVDLFVGRALAAGCGMHQIDAGDVARFRQLYARHWLDTTLPYPGVHELLRRLQRHCALAVLTNKGRVAAEAVLGGLDLRRCFRVVLADDGTRPRKPDPRGLQELLAEATLEPNEALLVGDSVVDFDTARNAGTRIALARYGYGYNTLPVNRLRGDEILLDRPLELLKILAH